MASVSLHNVTRVFDGSTVAVSDLTLDIPDGELMVIVGPSGCGKTTTLRLIAGLEKPTSGNIYIAGDLVTEVPPRVRDMAMVFQDYALYPHMTVYENMAFALRMRRLPAREIQQRIKHVAVLLGIEHLLDRKPRALSGGQCQRAALGKAIVRRPNAFLFDEPLSNLDAQLRASMRTELKALHGKLHTTTIYVTHDQCEAMTLGERICVLSNGMTQQVGSPAELYDRPVNRFVAGFLGTPPMNLLAGLVKFEDDIPQFVLGPDTIILPLRLKHVLARCHDRQMVLGIRPEDLSLSRSAERADNVISSTIQLVETLGVINHVHLRSRAGQEFTACADPHTKLRVGQAVNVPIDPENVHVFEPTLNGRNVTLSPEPPE